MTTTSKIKERYGELINLLSLIGNNTKIDGETENSLTIHVCNGKKELLTFKLTIYTGDVLDVLWKTSDSINYIGSLCFPDFLTQVTIYKKITSRIMEWHHEVYNNGICLILEKANNSTNKVLKDNVKIN